MSGEGEIDLEAWRARLSAHREEIVELTARSAGRRAPVELDQSRVGRLSRMDALQDQAMALEAERRRALELRRIDAALARIAEGEFGCCVTCGEEIAPKRLELDPTTPVCIACAGGRA
jgi:DnaK suppressor protein